MHVLLHVSFQGLDYFPICCSFLCIDACVAVVPFCSDRVYVLPYQLRSFFSEGTNTNEIFYVANVVLANQFVLDHRRMSQSTCVYGSLIPHSAHPIHHRLPSSRCGVITGKHKLLARMGFYLVDCPKNFQYTSIDVKSMQRQFLLEFLRYTGRFLLQMCIVEWLFVFVYRKHTCERYSTMYTKTAYLLCDLALIYMN
jgi:hypothetical protein